jgi:sRNA-binding protein
MSTDTHPTYLQRRELEELVLYLCDKYPSTFFSSPTLKRPLKKNIIVDLERHHTLDDHKREAAVSFYTRDWYYKNTLLAGAKRVDLDGKEVGTVTELEQVEAQNRVRAKKQELREKREQDETAARMQAITTVGKLHDENKIPTDSLSKITAPPKTNGHAQTNGDGHALSVPVPVQLVAPVASTAPDLARLRTLWASIDAMFEQNQVESDLAVAVLKIFGREVARLVATLEEK